MTELLTAIAIVALAVANAIQLRLYNRLVDRFELTHESMSHRINSLNRAISKLERPDVFRPLR